MPRINVDDELRGDPRFHALCNVLPRPTAYGALLCLWELGQSYWKKNESLIPHELAELTPNFKELAQVGLAIKTSDGVYCSGAKERWSFLLNRSEAGRAGGIASAKARKEKFGTSIPTNATNSPEANDVISPEATEANVRSKTERPKPSSSSSSSSSLKQHNKTNMSRSGTSQFDFEGLFREYPKRPNTNKAKGISFLTKTVKTTGSYEQCFLAVRNYKEYVEQEKLDPKFIKQFSTWASQWQEWIEPQKQKQKKNTCDSWVEKDFINV